MTQVTGLGCNDFTVKCAIKLNEKNGGYEEHNVPAEVWLARAKDNGHKIALCEEHVKSAAQETWKGWKLIPIHGKQFPEFAKVLNQEHGHSE